MILGITKLFGGQNFFQFFCQGGDDLEEVSGDAVVGIVENESIRIGIHGDHGFAGANSQDMVNGS